MEKNQISQTVKKSFPWIARVLALIAILAFFLPFCTVSCSGQELDTMSASEMAFGKEISSMGQTQKVDGEAKVLVLLLLPLIVIGCSFIKKQLVSCISFVAESVLVLLYNNYLLKSLREVCADYNCSVRTEIGFVLFQVHGWLMLAIGVIGIIAVIVLSDKDKSDDTEFVLSDRPFPKPEDVVEATKSPRERMNEEPKPEAIVLRTESVSPTTAVKDSSETLPRDKEWKKPEEPLKKSNKNDLWNRPTGF